MTGEVDLAGGDALSALYDAASDDHELSVLEELAERAGLIWTCPVAPWTNRAGDTCALCGRTFEEALLAAPRIVPPGYAWMED